MRNARTRLIKRLVYLCIILTLLLLLGWEKAPPVASRPQAVPTPEAENVTMVAQVGGGTYAVFLDSPYAYMGEGPRLTILDMTNPAAPTRVGQTAPLPDVVFDIQVVDGYAYLASDVERLVIVDVHDPARPIAISHQDMRGEAIGVQIHNNRAYVAGEDFTIIDVTDPTSPTLAGRYSHGRYDVYVSQGTAYLADAGDGLRIVDVRDPATPTEIGRYDSPGEVRHLALDGSTAYVADGFYGGLRTVDVSTPPTPRNAGL